MDNQLNIFYSYSQGGYDSIKEIDVLENNVTRSLILTLKHCDQNELITNKFIEFITGKPCSFNKHDFDLQSLNEKNITDHINSMNPTNRYFLGISPAGEELTKVDVPHNIKQVIIEIKKDKQKVKQFITILEEYFKGENDIHDVIKFKKMLLKGNRFGLKRKDLDKWKPDRDSINYLYSLCKGSVPDAWIMGGNGNVLILIENKIYGKLSRVQNERHIHKNLKDFNKETNYIIKSWRDIYNFFVSIKMKYDKNNLLVNHFVEYLEMIGLGPLTLPDDLNTKKSDWGRIKTKLFIMSESVLQNAKLNNSFEVQNHTIGKEYIGIDIFERKLMKSENDKFSGITHISIGINTQKKILAIYIALEKAQKMKKLLNVLNKKKEEFSIAVSSIKNIDNVVPQVNIAERWFIKQGDMEYRVRKTFKSSNNTVGKIDDIIAEIQSVFAQNVIIKNLKKSKSKKEIIGFYKNMDKSFIDRFFFESKSNARTVTPVINIRYEFSFDFINNCNNAEDVFSKAINNLLNVYEWISNNTTE